MSLSYNHIQPLICVLKTFANFGFIIDSQRQSKLFVAVYLG